MKPPITITDAMIANLTEWIDFHRSIGRNRIRYSGQGSQRTERPIPTPAEILEHIFERMDVGDSGCWVWTGSRNHQGYGNVTIRNIDGRVHRVSFWIFKGDPTPELKVCHRCNNPPCANPEHLYAASQKQNVRDAFSDGLISSKKGERNGRARLSEKDVIAIRCKAASGASIKNLWRDFNPGAVSLSCFREAALGESWKHIPMPQQSEASI